MGDEVQISARVELSSRRPRVPSELWFRFPCEWGAEISLDSDPFAVSLLLLAMKNRELLQIQGTLSKRLLTGLYEYQQIFHSWYPERFHLIKIEPTGVREDIPHGVRKTGCAFSGGVDSFYTLLQLRGGAADRKLTHALFMAGFDMPLNLTGSIAELTGSYQKMMKKMGISFITGSTNVRNFVNSVDWTNAHGQALAAAALFFKNQWEVFFIPSSYTIGTHPKWGTHPLLDPLLSTESMELVHHGAHANRVEKLAIVSRAEESYGRLRVCWIQDLGLRNCGQCEKCVRTMAALDILGVLKRYRTFNFEDWNAGKIRSLPQRTYQARLFARELMGEAIRRGKVWTWLNLGYSLLRREVVFRSRKRKRPEKSAKR